MIPSAFNVKQVDGVYWTLKIEWFFYLSILLLLFLKKIDKIINIIIFLIVIIFIISIVYKAHPYFQYSMLFICGINFFLIWKNQAKIINHLIIFSTILLAGISGKLEYFVVSCILISIMYLLVNNKLLFLNFKPFIFFGKISYAFYLIHQNFGHSIQIRLLEHGVVNIFVLILLPFSLSVFISYFITYFFEKPVARILKARI
jgi:peptidoglycan/LPS O-acetylase OafA/YrhL